MKKRFANAVEGIYKQKRVNNETFKGYICNVKIQNVKKPLVVNNGLSNVCIKDNNYEWFELYPDNANYAITIMYDNKNNLIEWYFDIAKEIGTQNGIPYEEDLYLDMVVLPNGQKLILDEEELYAALKSGEIQPKEINLAYTTLKYLEENYVDNFENLLNLTNYVIDAFKSKTKEK